MAKRKKDDDELFEEPLEAAETVEHKPVAESAEPAAASEVAEDAEPAEATELAEAVADEPPAVAAPVADDEEEEDEEYVRPQTPMLVTILSICNVVAVLAFGFLLIMALGARKRWSYQVFRFDVAMQGLPLEEERHGDSTHRLIPRPTLDPEWLKAAYNARGAKGVSEPFRAVENPELLTIRPGDISDELLKELFASHGGEPAATLDDEARNLAKKLPTLIDQAASGAEKLAKTDAEKRLLFQRLLWPLLTTTEQIDELDRAARDPKLGNLDALLVEAYKRRLVAEALTLLDIHRPGDPRLRVEKKDKGQAAEEDLLHRAGAFRAGKGFAVKLDQLTELLAERVKEAAVGKEVSKGQGPEGQTRDIAKDFAGRELSAEEKRKAFGFVLLVLNRLKGVDGTPLYPLGRAEVVSGIREFTQAADTLALIYAEQERRLMSAIARDRGEYVYPLDYHVHDPKAFASRVVQLCDQLKISLPNPKGFEQAVAAAMAARLGQLKTTSDVVDGVKAVLKQQGVVITEDAEDVKANKKVKEAAFDAAVARLADGRELGFIGKHREAVLRLQELMHRIEDRQARIQELQGQNVELKRQLQERTEQVAAATTKLLDMREESLRLAEEVFRLQDELFRAQVELADADLRNQLYHQRIRQIELRKRGGTQ